MSSEPGAKHAMCERMWGTVGAGQGGPDPHGRIPDFESAEAAAELLAELLAWRQARVIKANPDQPQLPARARTLREGKLVYMAVPKLADRYRSSGWIQLSWAMTRATRSAPRGRPACTQDAVADIPPMDLIVCGTVVVNRKACGSARAPATPTSRSHCWPRSD